MAAAHAHTGLMRMLDGWSQRYGVVYRKKVQKYTVRVTFDDHRFYTLFALTWNPSNERLAQWHSYFADYRLIEPMKNVY